MFSLIIVVLLLTLYEAGAKGKLETQASQLFINKLIIKLYLRWYTIYTMFVTNIYHTYIYIYITYTYV